MVVGGGCILLAPDSAIVKTHKPPSPHGCSQPTRCTATETQPTETKPTQHYETNRYHPRLLESLTAGIIRTPKKMKHIITVKYLITC